MRQRSQAICIQLSTNARPAVRADSRVFNPDSLCVEAQAFIPEAF